MSKSYNRKDRYYEKAKEEGYRSRAAFKLVELNQRLKLIKRNFKVLDLGCWPGSWLQVISNLIGPSGVVVGIDLTRIEPLSEANVHFIKGNAADSKIIEEAISFIGCKFNIVLSDMSPKLTGISELDGAQCAACAFLALESARLALEKQGHLVIKLFKSQDAEEFIKAARKYFIKVQRCALETTRNTSNEFYFCGSGFMPGN